MCNPARKEQWNRRLSGVGGIQAGIAEEIPRMVESHEDHNDAANHVNRFDACALRSDGFRHGRYPTECNKKSLLQVGAGRGACNPVCKSRIVVATCFCHPNGNMKMSPWR